MIITKHKDINKIWKGIRNEFYPFNNKKRNLLYDLGQLLSELYERREKDNKPIEIDLHNRLLINGDCVLISSEGARRHEQ